MTYQSQDVMKNCSVSKCSEEGPLDMNIPALICMILIELTAVLANIAVITIVLATTLLRENITYVFVLSLAITDLLISLTVLPLTIAAYIDMSWMLGNTMCVVQGILGTVFTVGSIFSICAISVERFYFIKWPMHYSAHMSMKKALCVLVILAIVAVIFGVLPLLGWGHYAYDNRKSYCTFMNSAEYAITLGVMCFAVPGTVTLCMYYGIYRVAKKTACQIQPTTRSTVAPIEGSSAGTDRDSGVSVTPESKPDTTVIDIDLFDGEDEGDEENATPQQSHWKAIRTLFIIIMLFLALWGPYFTVLFYTAAGNIVNHGVYLATTWLAFSTHAVNPLVYGLLNRNIRDSMIAMWQRLRERRITQQSPSPPPDGNAPDCEDFFQFLERTSSIPNDTIQTLDVQNLPNLPSLVEVNSCHSHETNNNH